MPPRSHRVTQQRVGGILVKNAARKVSRRRFVTTISSTNASLRSAGSAHSTSFWNPVSPCPQSLSRSSMPASIAGTPPDPHRLSVPCKLSPLIGHGVHIRHRDPPASFPPPVVALRGGMAGVSRPDVRDGRRRAAAASPDRSCAPRAQRHPCTGVTIWRILLRRMKERGGSWANVCNAGSYPVWMRRKCLGATHQMYTSPPRTRIHPLRHAVSPRFQQFSSVR